MTRPQGAAPSPESSDTRDRIIDAALEAFSQRGFEGATTREIAQAAGVNLGLIQYYFGGKEKLWKEAVERAFGEMRRGAQAVLENPELVDDRERTRLLIRAHVRFVARNPEFIRIMHDEGKRRGPRMRWLVDRHVKPLHDIFSALIVRSQASGGLPADIHPIHFLYILVGSVGIMFHQAEECRRISGVDPFDEAVVEDHARAVEYLFLGSPTEEDKK